MFRKGGGPKNVGSEKGSEKTEERRARETRTTKSDRQSKSAVQKAGKG